MLKILDLPLYLIGQRRAVERICQSKWSLVIGALLIVTAVIARNYDQAAILHRPARMVAPYAFSLISSLWIFCVLYWAYRLSQVKTKPSFWQQYSTFLGAFWMTAPIAWLYALPVEQWMNPVAAAQTNVCLLVIVSLWRVLLISRVASVLTGASFWATGVFVSAAASFEFLIAGFVQQFTNFEQSIASSMAGIRFEQSPADRAAEALIGQLAMLLLVILMVSSIIALGLTKHQKRPFPKATFGPLPYTFILIGITVPIIAGWLAKDMQQAETHWSRLESELTKGNYITALDYLEAVGPDAFPKGKAIPLTPSNYRAAWKLPRLLTHLDDSRPEWMRQLYCGYAKELVERFAPSHPGSGGLLRELTEAILHLPEGEDFIRQHSETWLNAPEGATILQEWGIHPRKH